MGKVTVFILAAGGEPQWTGAEPRQLLSIAGEPLIQRTVRLVRNFGVEPVVVTNKVAITSCVGEGMCFHPTAEHWIYDTILSTQNLWSDTTIFLVGDFLFHWESLAKVFASPTCCWIGRWGVFAIAIHARDSAWFISLMQKGRRQADQADSDELQQVIGDFKVRLFDFRDDLCDFDYVDYLQPTLDRVGWTRISGSSSTFDTVLVCLAAGDGSRMGLDYPKSLLNFDDFTLLETELEAFYRWGIRRAVICMGFKGELIQRRIENAYRDMSITYVENPKFGSTGAGYSLWLARSHWMNRPAVVIEADVLLHPELVIQLWREEPNTGLLDRTRFSARGDVVLSKSRKMVWPAKPHIKGIILPAFQLATDSGLQNYLDGGEIIAPLNKIYPLRFSSAQGLPWVEIDTKKDYKKAKLLWNRELKSLYSSR